MGLKNTLVTYVSIQTRNAVGFEFSSTTEEQFNSLLIVYFSDPKISSTVPYSLASSPSSNSHDHCLIDFFNALSDFVMSYTIHLLT